MHPHGSWQPLKIRLVFGALAVAAFLFAPGPLRAQAAIEVSGGAYFDRQEDVEALDDEGPVLAVRGVLPLGSVIDGFVEAARVELNATGEAGTATDYYVWGRNIWLVTLGAAADFRVGPAELGLSLGAGFAASDRDLEKKVGSPSEETRRGFETGNSPDDLLLLADVFLRYPISDRVAAVLRVGDYMRSEFEGSIGHNPSVRVGIAYQW